MLKPIAEGPGDLVDATGSSRVIDGRVISLMPPDRDIADRLLPVCRERRVVKGDECLVFSSRIPISGDSRCYGPIRLQEIDAVRRDLITS